MTTIQFGALVPSLGVQLGYSSDSLAWPYWLKEAQDDADAITRLAVRGILLSYEKNAARRRLVKRMERDSKRAIREGK